MMEKTWSQQAYSWRAGLIAYALLSCTRPPPLKPELVLERTECFGTCPIYTLTVSGDGSAKFEGRRFTAVSGRAAWRIPSDTAEALIAAFERQREEFLASHPAGSPPCGLEVVTEGRAIIVLRRAGVVDSLSRYTDCQERGTDRFAGLAARIDQAVDVRKYVRGSAQ
jgi:hypothetical protein